MNKIITLLLGIVFLISSRNASPASRAYNLFDVLYTDDIEAENGIDGSDAIDVSSLGPDAYGFPNNESGDAVASWSEETSLANPEELSGYAQGDILMPPQTGRNGVREETLRWPKGHIPYVIEGSFSQQQRETIMMAIADYHRLTCLRFIPYNGQKDYITIQNKNTGCWSSVGRLGGRQEVNLQTPGCVTKKGTVIHELLHAIGFMHEQSRPERDDFVYVRYNNIRPGAENNFRKADVKSTNDFKVPYDYNSVMHYSEYAFSKNNQKTIEPKVGGVKLGQREGLSRGDVKKVNNMYSCKKDQNTFTGGNRLPLRYSTQNGFVSPAYNGYVPQPPPYRRPNGFFPQPSPYRRPNSFFQQPPPYRRPNLWGASNCCSFREPQSGWFGNVFQNWFGTRN